MGRRTGSLSRQLRRLIRDRSGHFALMTAITTPVMLAVAALAVDEGSLYLERREAQAVADIAAIAAASNPDDPSRAALVTLSDNGFGDVALSEGGAASLMAGGEPRQLLVLEGRYRDDPAVPATLRFEAGGEPANAVKIMLRTAGTRYFAQALIPPPEIVVGAIASARNEAAFSIGSRLASLEGGLANALLSGLLGGEVSLSAMDYDALLDTDIGLLGFLDALATEIELEAGSYRQVLDAQVTMGQIARALGEGEGVGNRAAQALRHVAAHAGGETLRLSRLIDLGSHAGNVLSAGIDRVGLEASALELLMTSALIAGGGRQIELDLAGGIPGLLSAELALAVGEPPQQAPWFSVGERGEIVRTAQTRLLLDLRIGGPGGLLGSAIRLPLYLELAFAEARLADISCRSGPASARVEVEARPGVAALRLAAIQRSRLTDFSRPMPVSPAVLVDMPLVKVKGQAQAGIANPQFKTLRFTADEIAAGTVKTVETTSFAGSLGESLFSTLDLEVQALGLGLGLPSGLTGTLADVIGAAAPAVDGLLNDIVGLLGLSLGEADIRVHGVLCGRAVLVQ